MTEGAPPEVTDQDIQRLIEDDQLAKVAKKDSKRWDETKARTIGSAIYDWGAEQAAATGDIEKDPFDNSKSKEQRRIMEDPTLADIREASDVRHYERLTGEKRKELDYLASITDPLELRSYFWEYYRNKPREEWPADLNDLKGEQLETRLAEIKEKVDTELKENIEELEKKYRDEIKNGIPLAKEEASESLKDINSTRAETLKDYETDFEEFYELNPEAFSQMPTNEFIDAYRQLLGIEKEVKDASRVLTELTTRSNLRAPNEALVNEVPLSGPDVSAVTWAIENFMQASESEPLVQKIEDITENGVFDKTPRQIAEGLKAVADEALTVAKERLEDAEHQKQEFMAKYAKQGASQPSVAGAA